MFGRPVPKEIIEKRGEPVRYWGARAIFHPGTKHPSTFLPTGKVADAPRGWPQAALGLAEQRGHEGIADNAGLQAPDQRQHRGGRVQGWRIHAPMQPQSPLRLSLPRRLAVLAGELPV